MTRRPPVRRCPRCGGQHCAWNEHTLCARCSKETAGDAAALADMVGQARQARLFELGAPSATAVDVPASARRPVPVVFEATGDDIPY